MARPRLVSDEQILTAMKTAVLEHGPAVPLDQVASALGVTAPALLKRFGSREALLLAALRPPEDARYLEVLEAGPTDEPFDVQLRRVLTLMFDFLKEVVPCLSALRESRIPASKLYIAKDPLRAAKAMQAWLASARDRELIADCAIEPAAFAILGAIHARAFSAYMFQQPHSLRGERKYVEDVVRFFTQALVPSSSSPAAAPVRRRTSSSRS